VKQAGLCSLWGGDCLPPILSPVIKVAPVKKKCLINMCMYVWIFQVWAPGTSCPGLKC
jgi:hypothetical protein